VYGEVVWKAKREGNTQVGRGGGFYLETAHVGLCPIKHLRSGEVSQPYSVKLPPRRDRRGGAFSLSRRRISRVSGIGQRKVNDLMPKFKRK
jgi:hypothetical protein